MKPVVEERHVRWAVHGLEPVSESRVLINHRREHDVRIVVVVPALFVEVFPHEVAGPDVLIAVTGLGLLDIRLHDVPQDLTLRKEEWNPLANFLGSEDEETQVTP